MDGTGTPGRLAEAVPKSAGASTTSGSGWPGELVGGGDFSPIRRRLSSLESFCAVVSTLGVDGAEEAADAEPVAFAALADLQDEVPEGFALGFG